MVQSQMKPRVIVVGAGPAGTRCAETLVKAGIRPTIIDEGPNNGGQIYRRQPHNFTRSYKTLYGSEAARAKSVHHSFDAIDKDIDYLPETLIWNIADGHVFAISNNKQQVIPFDALILCTGTTDRLMPLKGWNLAGTFSMGGAQVALKSQACAIGRQVVFLGTGPLLYLVAAQYAKAGAGVAAVLDTSSWFGRVKAATKLLAQPSVLWKGISLTADLLRARVPLYTGVEPLSIEGSAETGVSALTYKNSWGRTKTIDCDAVAMGYHLRPETQLADLARCDFYFDQPTRQWLPQIDSDGRSTVPGVYLAGDGAHVLGANAAEVSGQIAALAVLDDFGQAGDRDAHNKRLKKLYKELASLRRFASGLNQAFPWPAQQAIGLSDDTVLCRCEAVSAGELRRAVCEAGAQESNRAKAFSRVGMGRCQGRYCGNAAAEIIAHTGRLPVEKVGRLRGQAPVKPLPIASQEDVK
jgi:NADPH-dependent 2,4-dienoyl-CoA reductase/sulfur reductase-like enzyme